MVTAMIENIKQKILQLDGGAFQNLCNSYLYKEKGYSNIMSLGSQAGTSKTTIGTPDAYFLTSDSKYVFAEYTTKKDQVFQKIKDDLEKCLDVSKTKIPHDEIAEIIYCHTSSNINPNQNKELHSLCIDAGVHLDLIGIDKLAEEFHLYHRGLAKQFLGISLDTGQIQQCDDFIKTYNANRMAAPIDTEFSFREIELAGIEDAFKKTDIVILSGAAGAGKTRLALQYAQNHAEIHDEKLLCLRNNELSLYEDIELSMGVSGNYFLMIDDANQLSGLHHVIKYTNEKAKVDGYNVKILITVRDYAIGKVMSHIREITTYETIKVDRFKDGEIKALVESALGIKNQNYLEQIVKIAEGNARLAILAGKIACDTNRLDSIRDASELYAGYYGAYLQDNHLLTNNKLLVAAFIVAFLEAIHLDRLDILNPIFESCKMSREDFIESIYTLHEKEIVDICNEKAVKFSEQCLSNYLLKLVFYDKKLINLQQIISICFESYKHRVIYSINTLMNIFRNEDLHKFIEEEIKSLWDKLLTENTPWFFDFAKVFFRVNPTAMLLILKNKIDEEESVLIDGKDIDFQTGRNYQSINNDIIEILSGFMDMTELSIALDLFFQYYLKRPDLAINFYHAINQGFGVRKGSFDHDFYTQQKLIEKMIEYSDDWKQEPITLLFLEIAGEFLKMVFNPVEGGRGDSFISYHIPLNLSNGVEVYRKLIWQALNDICTIGLYENKIRRVLNSYNGPIDNVSDSVLEFDIAYIKALIESHFPASDLQNMLLTNHLVRVISRKSDAHETLFSEYFENENFKAYLLLKGSKGSKASTELDWKEREKLKRQAIEEYVSNASIEMIYRLINIGLDIGVDHNKWEISEGLRIVMDTLLSRKDDYVKALKYYLKREPSNDLLYPVYYIKNLFSFLPDDKVVELIENCGSCQKNSWMYAYYHELPIELINKSHLQGLYDFLTNTSDKDIMSSVNRDVNFLEKYSIVDKDVLAKSCKIILSKTEYSPFITGIYFGLMFNRHHNSPKEVIQKFQNGNLGLLVDIYFFMEEQKDSSDYDGQFLREIYLTYPPILNRYIDNLVNDREESFREYDEKLQCFFEVDNFIEIYDQIFEQLLQNLQFPTMRIPPYLKALLTPKKDAPELLTERQNEWIKHCIRTSFANKLKMDCLFSFISELDDGKKYGYVELFLKHNQSFEIFKKIPLTPTSWSYSGSAIPTYQGWTSYLTSLLPLFVGLDWLEHRNYIEKEIIRIREWIKQEEINEFLRG